MFYYLKGFFRINTIKTRHNKCFYKSLSIYNEKVFCTPGLWTKPFERIFYRSINNYNIKNFKNQFYFQNIQNNKTKIEHLRK